MSRYINIPTVIFTDKDGKSYPIKDIRPIPKEETAFTIDLKEGDDIDDIATRPNVYGDGAEGMAYRIWDANIVQMYEADFDTAKMKTLRIPL